MLGGMSVNPSFPISSIYSTGKFSAEQGGVALRIDENDIDHLPVSVLLLVGVVGIDEVCVLPGPSLGSGDGLFPGVLQGLDRLNSL